MNIANLIILTSRDPRANPEKWTLVLPEDVPDVVSKDQEVMGVLATGGIARPKGSLKWYRAEHVELTLDMVSHERNQQVIADFLGEDVA